MSYRGSGPCQDRSIWSCTSGTLQVEWLILRGLERRTPLPEQLDLTHLLSCVAGRKEIAEKCHDNS